MSFYDAGCLATEDREVIVEVILKIKDQEKEAMKRASTTSKSVTPPPRMSNKPEKFSSLNKNWSNPRPNMPKR